MRLVDVLDLVGRLGLRVNPPPPPEDEVEKRERLAATQQSLAAIERVGRAADTWSLRTKQNWMKDSN